MFLVMSVHDFGGKVARYYNSFSGMLCFLVNKFSIACVENRIL